MNAAQIQSRLYTIERLLKTSSQTSIVTELPPSGEEGILYIFDRNLYMWDGAKYIVLFDTIQLSNTVWVNLDLTVSDASQRIFKSYDEAITWIKANDTPSATNRWSVILPAGLIPALKVYAWISIDCMEGTVIEKLDTDVTYTNTDDLVSVIVRNATIAELNVTKESSCLVLFNCTISNTVSNGLTTECILILFDSLVYGGDFLSYNNYSTRNCTYYGTTTNLWGTFNNCQNITIGQVNGKITYIVGGSCNVGANILNDRIYIWNSLINPTEETITLAVGCNMRLKNVISGSAVTIQLLSSCNLLTEQISPNISVNTFIGQPGNWVSIGELYDNRASGLVATNVKTAIDELALIASGEIIKIGEFDYTDLNIDSSRTKTIIFSDAKPKDKLFVRGFMVIDEEFEEDYYYESGNNIVRFICSETFIKATNIPNSDIRDIECVITLNGNDQDWIAGKASVYIEVKPFPTLA